MFERDGFYYWHYRYDDTNELAVVVRCNDFLNMSTLLDYFNEWRAQKFIKDEDMRHDRNTTRDEGWELALAFDLCPCMEVAYEGRKVRCKQIQAPS